MLLFRAGVGGETPMLCVTTILSQSTKLHTSPAVQAGFVILVHD